MSRDAGRRVAVAIACALAAAAGPALGQGNIDMSTVPPRAAVQLTIYNAEDLTLVREVRRLTVHEGENRLQFSWSGTLIDPTSVHLQFPAHGAEVEIVETTYPHDRPQVLTWIVDSAVRGAVDAEITYFTSGVSWAADYVAIADAEERTLDLEGHVRIANHSGAAFDDAQVRLVVGTINLVETVRSLAEKGLIDDEQAAAYRSRGRRDRWAEDADRIFKVQLGTEMSGQAPGPMGGGFGGGGSGGAPKEIVKEGLSEYFIFTVPGTETIPNGWAKRLRLLDGVEIAHETKYRYRPAEYGEQLERLFVVRNDETNDLGSTPLPDGAVRVFRRTDAGGLSLLATTSTRYVPIGQEVEIRLGVDPLVVHERIRVRSWRDDFWFRGARAEELFSPTQGHRILPRYQVVGWNDHDRWTERIRNFRSRPIAVEIRRTIPGDVTVRSTLAPTLHDFQTAQITATVRAGASEDLAYTVTARQGVNRKQERVELEEG